MKENKCWRWLSMLTALAMLLTLSPVSFLSAQEPQTVPPVGKQDLRGQKEAQAAIEYWASPEAAKAKLDPILLEKFEQGGKEPISLYVAARHGTDLSQYLTQTIVRPAVFGDTQNVYGTALVSNLLKIAQEPGVVALVASGAELREKPYDPETEGKTAAVDAQAQLDALRANEVSWAEAAARINDVGIQGWFDVLDGHKSKEAWAKGFDGEGVVVGVLDDGIDFAHPDLQGTYARVTDPASPYYGWPMAFSQVSMQYFAQEVYYQNLGALGITLGWNGSRWSETSTALQPNPQNKVNFQTLDATGSRAYTVPPTSLSGWYKMGTHPDRNLMQAYGGRVAVLVVDENTAGVYDTVYVDLDNDYDFTDEKPVTQASPEVYRDMDGDGYADISGGALVWISDGANTPPTADWLWGISCGDEVGTLKACPDSGSLVLFTGPFDVGYTHGTQCASNIAGQGVVNDGLTSQPFRVGGMVQGAAPKVGLMDFGNHYYTGTDEDEFLVAALGYDGIPGSGDEVQITSNSYGSFEQMWGSWGYFGRLITALNLTLAPNTVWIFSAGNEGPGYGPQEGDGGPTTIQTGSSTQYGSTNWDSIASAEQIVYGDPNSFYSKGPNRDTSSGVDVLANGGRGAGDEGLNYYGFNGAESWATWGGTSRSGPVAAGNLALVYQAYKERYGEWPTWDVAKALLKSGATNSVSSPFFQGAGVVNADRATDLAAGIYGVYATPDEWRVGDWQGTEYLNFASVAQPGGVYNKTYTVQNPSGYPITVGLSDGVMTLMDKTELSFTTSDSSQESVFNFHAPDYLMELDSNLIPADAEVMVVRYVHPYSTFDTAGDYTPNPNNSWRFMLYNWTDLNGDGLLWNDANSNGSVNHTGNGTFDNDGFERLDFANTEVQEGEYLRMDYEFGGLAVPIIVHNPLERMADGYFFGWQHRVNDGSVPQTTFKIGVEFYKRADWDWLTLSTGSLAVPPKGTATFNATVSVPGDAAAGAYEGAIFMNDPGDAFHAAHETALPVVVNVIADLPDGASVTLGGQALADTLYQNSHTFGYFNWYGGSWTGAGDWRHYFLNIDEADLEHQNLLIHTSWEAAPTDLNTWVLGPTPDCASNGVGPCAWFEPGIGQPDPSVFGPYTLQPIGASEPFRSGAAYPFQTSTGGPDDWLKVPLERDGLHEIALHNVVYNGEELVEQFRVDVGTIQMGAVMDPLEGMVTLGSVNALAFAESGTIDLWFTPTLEIPDLEVTLTGGLVTEAGPETDIIVTQSDPVGEFSAWLDCVATDTFSLSDPGTDYLKVYLDCPTGTDDPDLFLIFDSNGDGLFTPDDTEWSDGRASGGGCSEQIEINNPPLGDYAIFVDGYTIGGQVPCVSTMPTTWQYWWRHPGYLPTEEMEVFSDTVDIAQDTVGDPTTASYSMTVTTDERSAALNVELSGIPSGANVDLYVTDVPTGTIVGQSLNAGQEDELIRILAPLGDYRFAAGTQFTIWVHGESVPMPTAQPHLRVWWDANNVWLSAEHPDVHVQAIGASEPVSATLHFAKEGWQPGDPPVSARVLAGPSVLPGAFDELVTIQRSDVPTWDPTNLAIDVSVESARGPAPIGFWSGFPYALVAGGEVVTYTARLENLDAFDSDFLTFDVWPVPEDYAKWYKLAGPTYTYPYSVDGVDWGLISGPTGTFTYNYLADGIAWQGVLPAGEAIEIRYWVEMPPTMSFPQNHSSGVDVYLGWDAWLDWDMAGAIYLSASYTGVDGSKVSNPPAVLAGQNLTYEISLANPSAQDPTLYFKDVLPAEVTFVSATGGASYDAGTHTVTWSGVVPGTTLSTVDLDIVVQAKPDLPFGYVIVNQATLAATPDGAPIDTMSASTVIDSAAYLELEKSVNYLIGDVDDTLTYNIVFANNGIETAVNAVMTDPLPETLTLLEATLTASVGTAQLTGDTITWQGNLAPGQQVTVSFQATVNDLATAKLALINPAWIVADNFPWRVYSSALTEILGSPAVPDITVAPPALEETLEIGASAAVSLTIGNAGTGPLAWSLSEAPVVDWLSETPITGTVAGLETDEVVVTFDAAGLVAGIYTTTLEISSNDPDEPLVVVPVTLTVLAADLGVEPAALELALYEGTTGSLSLVVSNAGDAALDWTLTEVTPVDWLSEDPVDGTLAAGDQVTVTVLFDSTGLMAGEVLTTTLHISGSAPDAPYVDVPVTLTVLGELGYKTFLPIVLRR